MTNKMINSAQAPAAVGPYSHSVLAGNTLYISGQLGLDPQSGEMKTTVEEQAKQAFINIRKSQRRIIWKNRDFN
ncbi:endoribonuclease L-PSP [Enterococcus sp. DIV2416]